MQVTLVREKETKRTVRYIEPSESPDRVRGTAAPADAQLGQLYVPKPTLAKLGNPPALTITLEAAPQQLAAAA